MLDFGVITFDEAMGLALARASGAGRPLAALVCFVTIRGWLQPIVLTRYRCCTPKGKRRLIIVP
ncbi:MAG: hypothetical protein OWU84_03780 [Firmicutes bacterium]|nr:hypothetical protein [Bacillota bacterium]